MSIPYLTKESLAQLAAVNRLEQCLVRMSQCRFVAAAQDAQRIIDALEKDGDYCRDVQTFNSQTELLTGGVRQAVKDERGAIALNLWRSRMPSR